MSQRRFLVCLGRAMGASASFASAASSPAAGAGVRLRLRPAAVARVGRAPSFATTCVQLASAAAAAVVSAGAAPSAAGAGGGGGGSAAGAGASVSMAVVCSAAAAARAATAAVSATSQSIGRPSSRAGGVDRLLVALAHGQDDEVGPGGSALTRGVAVHGVVTQSLCRRRRRRQPGELSGRAARRRRQSPLRTNRRRRDDRGRRGRRQCLEAVGPHAARLMQSAAWMEAPCASCPFENRAAPGSVLWPQDRFPAMVHMRDVIQAVMHITAPAPSCHSAEEAPTEFSPAWRSETPEWAGHY